MKVNDLLYEQLYRFKWVIIISVHFFFFDVLGYAETLTLPRIKAEGCKKIKKITCTAIFKLNNLH